MKPRRRDPQRSRRSGGGCSTAGHHNPVLGLCRFLLGVIILSLVLFVFFYFILGVWKIRSRFEKRGAHRNKKSLSSQVRGLGGSSSIHFQISEEKRRAQLG